MILIGTLILSVIVHGQNTHENFKFELRFGILKGGEATFELDDTIVDNESKLIAKLHGYTTGIAALVYGVDDQFESIIDSESLLPETSLKKLHEKHYRFQNQITYDHERGMVFSEKSGWHETTSGVCDISSLIFTLMHTKWLNNLQIKNELEFPFWDTDNWYTLDLKFVGYETITTPLGTFQCIRIEPQEVGGRFFNPKNPINVWITNDDQKLPVLMELNFSIGTVKCILTESNVTF